MKFSERMGYTKPLPYQTDSISKELRNDISNFYIRLYSSFNSSDEKNALNNYIWTEFFHLVVDEIYYTKSEIINKLNKLNWFELYDFIEFLLKNFDKSYYFSDFNTILEHQNSAYRFVDKQLVAISTETDMQTVEKAINLGFDDGHIRNATKKLSDKNPDYPKIIGESIDGVEIAIKNVISDSLNKEPTDKYGENIKILKSNGFLDDHPAYIEALNKLYGYASDGGIRHPKSRDYTITEADAVFAVEMCSAFISLLKFKASTFEKTA